MKRRTANRRPLSDYRYPGPYEIDVLLIPIDDAAAPIRSTVPKRRALAWIPADGEIPRVREPAPRRAGRKARPRRPECCTVGYMHSASRDGSTADRALPSIKISGLWLAECGFVIGCKVRVEVIEGSVMLTPAAEPVASSGRKQTR